MNIFEEYLNKITNLILKNQKFLKLNTINNFKGIAVEIPPPNFNFDLSCNAGLVLGKINKINPKDLADKIKDLISIELKDFEKIEIAGPGFLNFKLKNKFLILNINKILENKKHYGKKISNNNYNIEFVSANPTGPMHVGHCRGAIYGDVLANLLKFNGNKVTKEYYINDYGNQIENFAKSVFLRIREIKYNEKFILKKDLYPGEYIVEISKKIIKSNLKEKFNNFEESFVLLKKESLKHSMNLIKSDLRKLGIIHDNFFSESDLVKNKLVDKAVNYLKRNNYVEEGYLQPPKGEIDKSWKKTKRLIFKSTLFGDDTDRAMQKNDGSWTYFANDVGYHMDKVNRNYEFLINVLGADHTGYVKRITAAVSAVSKNKVKLNCKVCQLVKLYKNGKPFKMSKRAGDFISAEDLLNEVNKDSIRFMMLNRSNDVELDFDFDKVLEKSKDNPVFYVQYSFARINSLFRTLKKDLNYKVDLNSDTFSLNENEIKILRKVFEWPKIIETASSKYEPHRITYYLYELATLFHSYWSKGNEDENFKFIENGKIKRKESISIIILTAVVIQNGMNILGVSLPDKM
ncbi:MAG: arginine--tRNA ligase [Candidatus Pelagibacter sp. TMED153]|nr:MAG: arginine--tRNA ligase [Candidatus Pelagibacter sp. TMED153]